MSVLINKAKIYRSLHKDRITEYNSGFKFYLVRENANYVLGIKMIDENTVEKFKFSLTGVIISHVLDHIDNETNTICRKSGNKVLVFNNKYELIYTKLDIELRPIEKFTKEKYLEVSRAGLEGPPTFLIITFWGF